VRVGDTISLVKEKISRSERPLPSWLAWDVGKKEGKVVCLPKIEDIQSTLDTALIVEFYSR